MSRARDNPFATDRILARINYRPQGNSIQQILTRLIDMGGRGAIVGPEGHGKTTLLEHLIDPLRSTGYQPILLHARQIPRLRRPPDLPRRIGPDHAILLDSAESLGRVRWWRFCRLTRSAGIVLVTAHSPGLLPTLIECTTCPDLLAQIICELHHGPIPDLADLFARHNGNIRTALRELYDRHAGRG